MTTTADPTEADQARPAETDYAVPPGSWLEEWIDDRGLSRHDVAVTLGWSSVYIEKVLDGRVSVTAGVAVPLERLTGIPAYTWLRYEAMYRADKGRLSKVKRKAGQ